jgi:hypothetical protein
MHTSSLVRSTVLYSYNKKGFCLQKKVISLIFGIKGCAACRNSFKAHNILTMASIYVTEVQGAYKLSEDFAKP